MVRSTISRNQSWGELQWAKFEIGPLLISAKIHAKINQFSILKDLEVRLIDSWNDWNNQNTIANPRCETKTMSAGWCGSFSFRPACRGLPVNSCQS